MTYSRASVLALVAALLAAVAAVPWGVIAQELPQTPSRIRTLQGSPLGTEDAIYVGLQWEPVAGAADHQVRLIKDRVEKRFVVSFTTCNPMHNACDYIVVEPAPGEYEFSVRARSDAGESKWSSPVRYRILPAPAPPTVRVEGADLIVSWDGPADTPSWAYYNVCWSIDGDDRGFCPNRVSVNHTTSYRFFRPRPGTYRIRFSVEGDWLSPWSDEAVVMVEDRVAALVAPPIPRVTDAVFLGSADDASPRAPSLVTWRPSAGADFYDVKLRVGEGIHTRRVFPNEPLRTDDSSFQVNTDSSGAPFYAYWAYWHRTDAQAGDRLHEFAVRAGNAAGVSSWSYWDSALGRPARFELQLTDFTARFQWDAVPEADVYQLCQLHLIYRRGDCELHEATSATVRLRDLDAGMHDFHVYTGRKHEHGGYWWGPRTDGIVVDVLERSFSPRISAEASDGAWLITVEWPGDAATDRYQIHWRELRPRLTVDYPITLARRSGSGDEALFSADLRLRQVYELRISLRAWTGSSWGPWTEWLDVTPTELPSE